MNNKKNDAKKRCGFTMVELMAMLVIIGLLSMVVGSQVVNQIDKARVTTTRANLKKLHAAVQQFKITTGSFPEDGEGLEALISNVGNYDDFPEGGYLDQTELPLDAWGQPFIYERYPDNGMPFLIKSLGADKQEGGEGSDKDLLSTDAN